MFRRPATQPDRYLQRIRAGEDKLQVLEDFVCKVAAHRYYRAHKDLSPDRVAAARAQLDSQVSSWLQSASLPAPPGVAFDLLCSLVAHARNGSNPQQAAALSARSHRSCATSISEWGQNWLPPYWLSLAVLLLAFDAALFGMRSLGWVSTPDSLRDGNFIRAWMEGDVSVLGLAFLTIAHAFLLAVPVSALHYLWRWRKADAFWSRSALLILGPLRLVMMLGILFLLVFVPAVVLAWFDVSFARDTLDGLRPSRWIDHISLPADSPETTASLFIDLMRHGEVELARPLLARADQKTELSATLFSYAIHRYLGDVNLTMVEPLLWRRLVTFTCQTTQFEVLLSRAPRAWLVESWRTMSLPDK